jgi:N-acetylglucosaminyl-diphospho-decaprenol L-rhamnosyltransferase
MTSPAITVSIVSHGQNTLVNRLLADLGKRCSSVLNVILTENVPDPVPLDLVLNNHRYERIVNPRPKGFGANHNTAFARSSTDFFFVVNPDIRIIDDPFASLVKVLETGRAGAVGPLVRNADGGVEDSARRFPTIRSLLAKLVRNTGSPEYPIDKGAVEVDWLAGMFLGFPRATYTKVGGFDERYFLYYEDVDICRRLHSRGYKVVYETAVSVIHEARRASRQNPRLMKIHAASACRYLISRYTDGSRN